MIGSPLGQHTDGLVGQDLGVIGVCQYALSAAGPVFVRPASQVGSYGGWRWECDASHAAAYPSVPLLAELARRIEAVRADATPAQLAHPGPQR